MNKKEASGTAHSHVSDKQDIPLRCSPAVTSSKKPVMIYQAGFKAPPSIFPHSPGTTCTGTVITLDWFSICPPWHHLQFLRVKRDSLYRLIPGTSLGAEHNPVSGRQAYCLILTNACDFSLVLCCPAAYSCAAIFEILSLCFLMFV